MALDWLSYPDVQAARQDSLAIQLNARKMGYVAPPYPPAEVEAAIRAAEDWHREAQATLRRDITLAGRRDERRKQTFTIWGLMMIGGSTVLQAIATFLG
jgi:hypothetical protein